MLSVACVLMMAGSVLSACTEPEVAASSYTPSDSQVLTAIPFIAEFTLTCANGDQPSLYADIDGNLVPVTKALEGEKYQVRAGQGEDQRLSEVTLLLGFLDEGGEGCQDWRALCQPLRQRGLLRSQEEPRERRGCHRLPPRHHRRELRGILRRASSQLGTSRRLLGCCGFLPGFLFKVQTFGLVLRCLEENVRPADKKVPSETCLQRAVIYVLLLVIRKIKVKFKDDLMRFNYKLNIFFLFYLHLIKQFPASDLIFRIDI